MSTIGYRVAIAALLALLLGLGYLALPPDWRATALDCEGSLPDRGSRLVEMCGCELDLRAAEHDGEVVTVPFRHHWASWSTRDPELLRAVARLPDEQPARVRYFERHPERRFVRRDLVGYVSDGSLRSRYRFVDAATAPRLAAAAVLPMPFFGLLLLLRAQRRWRRETEGDPASF